MVKAQSRWLERLVNMALVIIMALTVAVMPASASKKLFPATKGSVALENSYADKAGIARLVLRQQIETGVASGDLVPVPVVVCPKLPEFRRYVRRSAAEFLRELDSRFYLATGRYLIVDSAVRSADVQKQVARHNRNAAPANGDRASSHERGTTFDIASRRVYFNGWANMRRREYRWLLIQLAYYQGIGKIHVIEERSCLHIMVREDYELPAIPSNSTVGQRLDETVDGDKQRPDNDSWIRQMVQPVAEVLLLP